MLLINTLRLTVRIDCLAVVLIQATSVRNTGMDVLLGDVNAADRIRIAVSRVAFERSS